MGFFFNARHPHTRYAATPSLTLPRKRGRE
jgi:hypothetical protein